MIRASCTEGDKPFSCCSQNDDGWTPLHACCHSATTAAIGLKILKVGGTLQAPNRVMMAWLLEAVPKCSSGAHQSLNARINSPRATVVIAWLPPVRSQAQFMSKPWLGPAPEPLFGVETKPGYGRLFPSVRLASIVLSVPSIHHHPAYSRMCASQEVVALGGDLNVRTKRGPGNFNSGFTPLHMACAYG